MIPAADPSEGRILAAATSIGARVGATPGQVYTLSIGSVMALVMGIMGLAPVLNLDPVPGAGVIPVPAAASPDNAAGSAVGSQPPPPAESVVTLAPGPTGSSRGGTGPAPDATGGSGPDGSSAAPPAAPVDGSPPSGPTPGPASTPPESSATRAYGSIIALLDVPDPGAAGAVAVGPDGHLYVATDNAGGFGGGGPSVVFEIDGSGRLVRSRALQGQPQEREHGAVGLVVEAPGRVLVADGDGARLVRLDLVTGTQRTVAEVPDLAPCTQLADTACDPGLDDPPSLRDAALAPDGHVYVTDAGQATIWRLDPTGGAEPEAVHQDLAYDTPDGLQGIHVDAEDRIWFTVGRSLDLATQLGGGLYRFSADGRVLVAAFPADEAPADVVVSGSGTVYVGLAGSGEIAVIDPAGLPTLRISDERLLGLSALDIGEGSLFVTTRPPSPGTSTLYDVFVDDRRETT